MLTGEQIEYQDDDVLQHCYDKPFKFLFFYKVCGFLIGFIRRFN